jgi:hypothetical protein
VRRELVRGAWQLALQDDFGAGEEDEVLTIAAKLEFSAELGTVRREVEGALDRAARVAALAVELGLAAGASLSDAQRAEALDRVIAAAAPPRAAVALRARARGESPAPPAKSLALVGAQRTQALAMAWSSLRALDLRASAETVLRADFRAAATRFEAEADAAHAVELVDRYLLERVAERGGAAREA